MALLTALVAAVFFIAGKRSPEDRLATVLGCSFGIVLIVPMGISRDKMEGTLDFVCGLPVEPRDIAASRLIAAGLFAIPWAVGIGAVWISRPFSIALNPVAVAAVAWLAMLTIGASATAIFTYFELESLLGAPIIAMLLIVAIVPRIVHAVMPDLTPASVLQFLASPGMMPVLAFSFLIFVLAVVSLSLAISVRALNSFRPGSTAT